MKVLRIRREVSTARWGLDARRHVENLMGTGKYGKTRDEYVP